MSALPPVTRPLLPPLAAMAAASGSNRPNALAGLSLHCLRSTILDAMSRTKPAGSSMKASTSLLRSSTFNLRRAAASSCVRSPVAI